MQPPPTLDHLNMSATQTPTGTTAPAVYGAGPGNAYTEFLAPPAKRHPCHNRGVGNSCRYDQVRRQRSRPSEADSYRAEPVARNDAAQALFDLGRSIHSPSTLLGPQPPSFQSNKPERRTLAACADGLATIAAGNDVSLYGPSSTIAFLRHVMPNASRQGSITPGGGTSEAKVTTLTVPERITQRSDGLAVLPQRRQADNFVLNYWEFIHPLFPVLHKPTFSRKYDHLWLGDNDVRADHESEAEEAIFNSILNLVFALGSRFSSLVDPSQCTAVADDFYQRSRHSYPFDILDSTSISLVQMLILTAVFLQSSQHASRCWNSLGLAVRVAQSLGLHVDHEHRRGVSQLELQMRRRIWHTCIHLDRLLATTFGRPSMIDRTVDVPIPDLIDDEYLSEQVVGQQPAQTFSRLGLFVSSCKLFELVEEILVLLYRGKSGVSSQRQANGAAQASEILTLVVDLNRRLDQFVENVPGFLKVSHPGNPSPPSNDHIHLQRQVLYSRFSYIRLLSLRPLLLMATRRELTVLSTSLDDEVISSCCRLCTMTACRLINTLYENLGTLYRSSGWHTVYFTFASAIVLLASSKLEDNNPHAGSSDIESSWARCFSILEHYNSQIQSTSQAASILLTMKARISDVALAKARPITPFTKTPIKSTPNSNGTPVNLPSYAPLNLEDIDFFAADDMSSAWYGQQLINLDWLDLPQA